MIITPHRPENVTAAAAAVKAANLYLSVTGRVDPLSEVAEQRQVISQRRTLAFIAAEPGIARGRSVVAV